MVTFACQAGSADIGMSISACGRFKDLPIVAIRNLCTIREEVQAIASLDDEDRVFLAETVLLLQESARIRDPVLAVKDETVPVAARGKRDLDLPPAASFIETAGIRRPAVEVAAEADALSLARKDEKNLPLIAQR